MNSPIKHAGETGDGVVSGLGLGLENRVAIVTGGSRGIGKAIVSRLAQSGVHVVINYLRDETAARETAAEVERLGRSALIFRGDVSDAAVAEDLAGETLKRFGRIDILVCNAGVWQGAPIELMDEELWDRVIDINLKGTWTVCRAVVPELKRAQWGRIVMISSTSGQRGEANYSGYSASKGGQIALTKSLAAELAAHHINVNAVAPGWVETEMTSDVYAQNGQLRRIEETIPLGRMAQADEIALPVVFLCSEWARHITGEILNVNGGSVLCG